MRAPKKRLRVSAQSNRPYKMRFFIGDNNKADSNRRSPNWQGTEAPKSNLQIPEKLQFPNLKIRSRMPALIWSLVFGVSKEFGAWTLVVGASLELGAWNLELLPGLSQKRLDVRQIPWPRHFGVRRGAFHQFHGLPDQFARRSIIGHDQPFFLHGGQSAADDFDAKGLWRLHRPEPGTVHRPCDQRPAIGFLDGVRHALGGNSRAGFMRGLYCVGDQLFSRAWPRAVLNRHDFRARVQRLQSVPDRVLPLLPADHQSIGCFKLKLHRQFRESRLHGVAQDQNGVTDPR